jgi:RteC protein
MKQFSNTLSMKTTYNQLYNEMQADISRVELPELKRVECCFRIATDYWCRLKELIRDQDFAGYDKEIDFFKNVKPLFTSEIEFYTLVYQAMLFQPENDPCELTIFWKNELRRLQKFKESKEEFVRYFKSGSVCMDQQYFLRENNDLSNAVFCKIYGQDRKYTTSHDCLVAALLAQEMYHEYVKEKLKRLLV